MLEISLTMSLGVVAKKAASLGAGQTLSEGSFTYFLAKTGSYREKAASLGGG